MSLPKPYYSHAGQTIYLGDCREILSELPKVDLVLTDPPYGIAYESSYTCETTTAKWMKTQIANDGTTEARDSVIANFEEWACFGSHKADPPPGFRFMAVWDKGPASGMGDLSIPFKPSFEFIYFKGTGWSGSRDEGVIKDAHIVTRASMGRVHPNQKPLNLLVYLASKHPAQTILDPFMGSGTTLVACKQLGRKGIGIEICEKYAEIAALRLSQEVMDFGGTE